MSPTWPSSAEEALLEVRQIDGVPTDITVPKGLARILSRHGNSMNYPAAYELTLVALAGMVTDLARAINDDVFVDLQDLQRWWPERGGNDPLSGPELLRAMASRYYDRRDAEHDARAAVLVCTARLLSMWPPFYDEDPAQRPTTLWKVLAHFSVISYMHEYYCGRPENEHRLFLAEFKLGQVLTQ